MIKEIYGIIHCPGSYNQYVIPDGADIDIEYAYGWFLEYSDEATHLEVVTLNQDDYWKGWFFYNDMEDGDEACAVYVNTEEHLDSHWESNSSSGHYDCLRYEHIVNGRIVTTRTFKTGNATMFDDAVDVTTHHQFENRLTTNDTERERRVYI